MRNPKLKKRPVSLASDTIPATITWDAGQVFLSPTRPFFQTVISREATN
jgi:hypothetical protein